LANCFDESEKYHPYGIGHEMLLHLAVYAVANLMQHDDLKTAAEDKFTASVVEGYKHSALAEAVKKAYEVSPPGAGSDKLRSIVVSTTDDNAEEIIMDNDLSHS
jgi:hypothetical protein